MFQFLIGTLKTEELRRHTNARGGFQFLIGTLKTAFKPDILSRGITVSIPDRYSKNFASLGHPLPGCHVSIPDRYSKNSSIPTKAAVASAFQFLIGTLKTSVLTARQNLPMLVSIPDRYSKNSFYLRHPVLFPEAFQFLIGTLKTVAKVRRAGIIKSSFNS